MPIWGRLFQITAISFTFLNKSSNCKPKNTCGNTPYSGHEANLCHINLAENKWWHSFKKSGGCSAKRVFGFYFLHKQTDGDNRLVFQVSPSQPLVASVCPPHRSQTSSPASTSRPAVWQRSRVVQSRRGVGGNTSGIKMAVCPHGANVIL